MEDLRRLVVESSRRHGLGGLAVGVVRKDERPALECIGLADHVSGRPVDADTVFRIASISKTLTAIGVMRLRDEGRLALDEPVNNHLKSIRVEAPPGAPEVTFRHLLTHTSGIGELPRVTDLWRREAWGGGRPFAAPSDLAVLYGGSLRTEVTAGAKWAYANHGFAVLGQLVEDISGRPFADYMREHVLQPLGMEHSDYVRSERFSETLATGYHWVFGRFRALKDYDLTLFGPGSVVSPLADMVEYASWLAYGTSRRTRRRARARDAGRDDVSAVQHRPSLPGHGSRVPPRPARGRIACAVTTGTTPVSRPRSWSRPTTKPASWCSRTRARSWARISLPRRCSGRFWGSPSRQLPIAGVSSSPHLWPELTGAYAPEPGFLTNLRAWEMTGGEVQVFVRGRRLFLRALSPLPQLLRGLELHPVDEHDPLLFAVDFEGLVIPVAFRADDSGRVVTLGLGAPLSMTFHRRAPWRSSRRRLTAIAGVGLAAAAVRTGSRRRASRNRTSVVAAMARMNLAESLFINSSLRVRELRKSIGPRVLAPADSTGVRRVLEVGCGQGVGVELILTHFPGARVVGVDLDPKMIRRAQRRLAASQRVEVRVGDVCALPFDDASFDVIVDFAVVHHVPEWRSALTEIARLLAPGGQFLFEDHDVTKHSLFARTFFAHPDERFTAAEFASALADAGIDVGDSMDDRDGHFVGRGIRQ